MDWRNVNWSSPQDPENFETEPADWINYMSQDGVYCDHLFIQLISEALCRDIIIMPVIRAERGPDTVKVSPLSKKARLKPFHLLYYSEARFLCGGHYQSIFPMNTEKGTNIIIIPWIHALYLIMIISW